MCKFAEYCKNSGGLLNIIAELRFALRKNFL